jgi:hypothetical protein
VPSRRAPSGPGIGFVYFIRDDVTGLTKVGWALNPQKRLANLQTGSPVPLRLLGSIRGRRESEAYLHDLFAHARRHGEWFELPDEAIHKIVVEKKWLARMPVVLDLEAPAPNPNSVDMTQSTWERRKLIEEYYVNDIAETVIAGMVGWSQKRLQKELLDMAKLGYFRGVRLNLRTASSVRGLKAGKQHGDLPLAGGSIHFRNNARSYT